MYTPQTESVPMIVLPETTLDYPVIAFFRSIVQPYARALRFKEPKLVHGDRMIGAWHDFNDKKIRLIVGFRHAYGDDPQLMAYVIHHVLPKAARKAGRPFKKMTHAHFIYGAEVPLWTGKFVHWLLPRAGAVPINHIHMDAKGMNRIRKIISDGDFPLALAPEGHVTYASETVGELETGTARFGFWCMEDLEKKGRTERVVFLPVSMHYRYGKNAAKELSKFLASMESECGLPAADETAADKRSQRFADRLRALGTSILSHLAAFYAEIEGGQAVTTQEAVLESVLAAAERLLCLAHDGEPMARIYRIRQHAWDRIYRDDIAAMTPLRKYLSGRETGEAWYAMRHMETAEILCHVRLTGIPDGEPVEIYMEAANNFYDIIERQKGGTLRNRANILDKYAVIVPGEPVILDGFRDLYRTDKKAALAGVTDEIRHRFETCIEEYRQEYRQKRDRVPRRHVAACLLPDHGKEIQRDDGGKERSETVHTDH